MSVYLFSVYLHVIAAVAWLGSMIFFAAVVVPLLRREEFRATAPLFVRHMGVRFRNLGRVTLGVLVVTGIANLYLRGLGTETLTSGEFWSTGFGRLLAYKLGFVLIAIVLTFVHEVTARAHAEAQSRSREDIERARRVASVIGRAMMILSLVIVLLAVLMVRGCAA